MDLFKIERNSYFGEEPSYKPIGLVEGYSSLIWTERYQNPGEFLLKTPLVEDTLAVLPEMTLVTLRDSKEVMFVETHSIAQGSEGKPELTIKGRTLEAFLEYRYNHGPYGAKYSMARSYTPVQAAAVLIWNAVVNTTINDVTHGPVWGKSFYETVRNTAVSNSVTISGTSSRRWLQGGSTYPQLIDLLRLNNLGIRMIRPDSGPAQIVTVNTTDGSKGLITNNVVAETTKLRFDLYNGLNRTVSQSTNPRVIFHHEAGHILDPSYLFSVSDFRNDAFVVASTGIAEVFRDPDDSDLTGLDRRGLWVDAGQPGPDESPTDFQADIPDFALKELQKYNRTALFEGQISEQAPYIYNTDYGLGDFVTVISEYGVQKTMQIGEYVRTSDISGERGYPGLI